VIEKSMYIIMGDVMHLCFLLLLTTSSVIASFSKYLSFLWENANIGNLKCDFSAFCITGDVPDKNRLKNRIVSYRKLVVLLSFSRYMFFSQILSFLVRRYMPSTLSKKKEERV
jgi:hypothetical protein